MPDEQMNPYTQGEIKIFVDDLAVDGPTDWDAIANQEAVQEAEGVDGFQLWGEVDQEIQMSAWNTKEKLEEIYPNANVTIVEHGSFSEYQQAQSEEGGLGAVYMGHGESVQKTPMDNMYEAGRKRHLGYDKMYEDGKERHQDLTQRRVERSQGELDLKFQASFRNGTEKQLDVKSKDYMSVEGNQSNASFTREADDLVGKLQEKKLEFNQELDDEFAIAAAGVEGEPYEYGKKSLDDGGLDCSGCIIHAFKEMGINVSSNIRAHKIYSKYTRPLETGEKGDAGSPIFYRPPGESDWQHVTIMTSETDIIHGSADPKNRKFLTTSASMHVFGTKEKRETRKIMWDKVFAEAYK